MVKVKRSREREQKSKPFSPIPKMRKTKLISQHYLYMDHRPHMHVASAMYVESII
jgi:hypothetical protein